MARSCDYGATDKVPGPRGPLQADPPPQPAWSSSRHAPGCVLGREARASCDREELRHGTVLPWREGWGDVVGGQSVGRHTAGCDVRGLTPSPVLSSLCPEGSGGLPAPVCLRLPSCLPQQTTLPSPPGASVSSDTGSGGGCHEPEFSISECLLKHMVVVISVKSGSQPLAERSPDLVSLGRLDLQTRLLVTQHPILCPAHSGRSVSPC